jgi:hypothetical protein
MRITALILSLAMLIGQGFASRQIKPTTTLEKETANNTSAADSFLGQPNDNIAPGNVSKVDIHTLLPAAPNTKLFVHMLQWWGNNSHPNIGYSSLDPSQATRDVTDVSSRGFDGIWVNWYGQGSYEDKALLLLRPEIEKRAGFQFVISMDVGALRWHSPCFSAGTCTAAQAITNQIKYLRQTYFSSPAYVKKNGRPYLAEFGMSAYSPDWNAVQAANPDILMIHRNSSGWGVASSAGAFSWLATKTTDYQIYESLPYLIGFYSTAASHPTKLSIGSTFKGFNDVIASWAPPGGRHVAQLCGKTWLDTWALANQNTSQLRDMLQVVTWNDYEEGTEIQTGIDNCFDITAATSGTIAKWATSGDVATLHHYTVFVSTDGSNLEPVATLDRNTKSFDIQTMGLVPSRYVVLVKAVGQPSLLNHMSNPISIVIPGVWLKTPTTGTYTSPITVNTEAFSSKTITLMTLWIDGAKVYQVNASKFSISKSLKVGVHRVRVSANELNGSTLYSDAVNVTIK